MPTVSDELAAQGVTFTNAFATEPALLPRRARILTGRYSKGTGVYSNQGRHGGSDSSTTPRPVATWLQAGGYRAALVGKYINGYKSTYIPPGWDHWGGPHGPGGLLQLLPHGEHLCRCGRRCRLRVDREDVIEGGRGSDRVLGGARGDTIRERDGSRDRVRCGRGRDTAIVDRFDIVSSCETVRRRS